MRNVIGIYQIKNKINNHIYIGSSVNIKQRFRAHKFDLNRCKHHSTYLQRAWLKYGSISFEFTIIEECTKDTLLPKEQNYIDHFKPEYNICKIAGNCLGVKHSLEARLKNSMNNRWRGIIGKDNPSSIPIYQYDLKGNFIKSWENAVQVQNDLGYCAGNIRKCCRLKGTSYSFVWSDIDYGILYPFIPKRNNREKMEKAITQYDLQGIIVKQWNSCIEATTYLNKLPGSLSSCLKNKTKTAYGFIWKYYKKMEEVETS